MSANTISRVAATLPLLLRSFRLPAFAREYAAVATRAGAEGLTHEEYLLALGICDTSALTGGDIP